MSDSSNLVAVSVMYEIQCLFVCDTFYAVLACVKDVMQICRCNKKASFVTNVM